MQNVKKLNANQRKLLLDLQSEFPFAYNKISDGFDYDWDYIIDLDMFYYYFIELCKDIEIWYRDKEPRTKYPKDWPEGSNLDSIIKRVIKRSNTNEMINHKACVDYKELFTKYDLIDFERFQFYNTKIKQLEESTGSKDNDLTK